MILGELWAPGGGRGGGHLFSGGPWDFSCLLLPLWDWPCPGHRGPGLEEEGWVPGTCQTVSLQDRELGPEELDGEWPLLVAVAGGRCP